MLVLSRKPGESIQIDANITVVVLGVSGNRVRFGIEAPPHVSIDRSEVAAHHAERTPEFESPREPLLIPCLVSGHVHEIEVVHSIYPPGSDC
ncbi:carbon storage regulator [Blastopirellula marina]|uniref:Translational regulator CsrA n=2 Tax=Blastopirellula marina TaxID=124 RepID=A0A2S8G8G2_9BACT|nr:carbon storage regulator [Blastopirellula marina]PTL45705.1 carbon storage regulator [Blastopirellula marina]